MNLEDFAHLYQRKGMAAFIKYYLSVILNFQSTCKNSAWLVSD